MPYCDVSQLNMFLGLLMNSDITISTSTCQPTIYYQSFLLLHVILSESATFLTSIVSMSVLSLLVKIFRCNLYLVKFKTRHLYFIFLNPSFDFSCMEKSGSCFSSPIRTKLYFRFAHPSTTFLSLFSHSLAYTNPRIEKGVILHITALCLSVFLMRCYFLQSLYHIVPYNQRNGPRHYATFLIALASEANQGHILNATSLLQRRFTHF